MSSIENERSAGAEGILTHALGYPRIGARRELKKAVEAYWRGDSSREALLAAGKQLREAAWDRQTNAGLDLIPVNDFSFYDHVLDMTCLLGAAPKRFGWDGEAVDLDTLFLMARGILPKREDRHEHSNAGCGCATDTTACEMTKWFDTNYHFLVPEFSAETRFRIASSKVFDELEEALNLGLGRQAKPVLIGPVSYLALGKPEDGTDPDFDRWSLLPQLLEVYSEILRRLDEQGAEWVQLDEPIFSLNLDDKVQEVFASAYETLSGAAPGLKILVANYFGELRDNLGAFVQLPVAALHLDAVRGGAELRQVLTELPDDKTLSIGVVDGRNVWKNDYRRSLDHLKIARAALGDSRLMVASSCSLLHSPVSLTDEIKLDAELRSWLSFADEKLGEIVALRDLLTWKAPVSVLEDNQSAITARACSPAILNPDVRARAAAVKPADLCRRSPFPIRRETQRSFLDLPLFPTTTIGSFPQTTEVRKARAKLKKGEWPQGLYDDFIRAATETCVRFQEEIGIDMLVHGEFERNDMVEYFGEQLDGFAFTENGWVQSYGSRCVKPPIIFGDVSRPQPMTVAWTSFAQSLTKKPMKGMLTGPVTILQWSFVRNDQPRFETTRQIALAIRDEVLDLEQAGIAAIQIDEPALREGLPLRQEDWAAYLRWAVDAFRLSASGVADQTQIHTHMCYSEFNDIIEAIAELDADVITIETSRSRMELLDAFTRFRYPNEIGPGVYDIHSPRVPSVEEMVQLMNRAAAFLPVENLWVNPDCGLKTRGWPEVKSALEKMVVAARQLRKQWAAEESLSSALVNR